MARTIEELVDEVNSDPRRGIGHEKVLTRIEFDHHAERLMKLKGYTRESVPKAVMDMLFPPGTPSRIPVASITGTNGKTTTARMLAHLFKIKGSTVGLATTDGVYIDGHRTVEGDMTGPVSARMILREPAVDVAVLETARGGLLRRGMGYRRCNVGAVLNVQADHLGLRGVETLEELALVKRIVVEVANDTAVLNADDQLCLEMADYTEANRLCYVTMNPAHSLVKEHIRAGGLAVVLEEGINGQMITLYDKGSHIPLLWAHQIPATLDGRAKHNEQNAMFAAGMAYSMDLMLEDIRHGLQTFDTTFFQAPGRMNVFHDHPFKVILDYAHNPGAVEVIPDEQKAIAAALEMAEKEDLLLIFGDDIQRSWNQIVGFNSETGDGQATGTIEAGPSIVADAPQPRTVDVHDGINLVRDDRAVRIARETED